MATLEINGKRVEVDDSFLSLSPDQQEQTVDEIAQSIGGGRGPRIMGNVNTGIANTLGGFVDWVNPFDKPHALNPFPEGTGSLREGMMQGMEAIGADVVRGEPDGLVESLARGGGEAAGAMIPATKGLQMLSKAPGMVGQLADDAWRAIATLGGSTAEVAAGATSEGARSLAKDAGAGPVGQDLAAIAGGGVALPVVTSVPRYAPSVVGGKKAMGAIKRAVAPYTEGGGREVARTRMQELAGGPERAEELARRVSVDDEFGRTPAQQTGDPNMAGVERLAADQDPNLRARLDQRATETATSGREAVRGMGGNEADAEAFFANRRAAFEEDLKGRAQEAIRLGEERVSEFSPTRSEADNSLAVRKSIDNALEEAVTQEKALWDAIPRGAIVETQNTKSAIQALTDAMPYAQRGDIPRAAQDVQNAANVYGETASVNDMHGLYSELRRVARAAMAGNDQNKNMARVANEIADAVLRDLGAVDGTTAIGRQINEARAYSAALHETFDRGAVGRLLKRTIDGDASVDPELALRRTVGRSGPEGAVSARQIEDATKGEATEPITDYIMDRFTAAARKATGEFDYVAARRFMAQNKPLMDRYPQLANEVDAAVLARENAEQFSKRITDRLAKLQKSPGKSVADGQTVKGILSDKNPARAARLVKNEAAKDASGEALAGVKAAFADELISRATGVSGGAETFSGDALLKALSDKKTKSALVQIFSPAEIGRMQQIAKAMNRVQPEDIGGSLSGAKPNRIIEFMARVAAARHGAELGGGSGGSLQTAQMASSRTKEMLSRLVSDKAAEIMARAVEDPELFKALLTDAATPKLDARVLPRLVPYLVGTTSAQAE